MTSGFIFGSVVLVPLLDWSVDATDVLVEVTGIFSIEALVEVVGILVVEDNCAVSVDDLIVEFDWTITVVDETASTIQHI